MKNLIIVLFSLSGFAQAVVPEPSASLKNFAPPSSPAFLLMDITPSNIIVPDNVQAFAIQTVNSFSANNGGLSDNNYAFEFQPYWYKTNREVNFLDYNNFTTDVKTPTSYSDYNGYNIWGDIVKKLSISVALMNGTFEVFENPQSYISIGARTRLISVRTTKQKKKIIDSYTEFDAVTQSSSVANYFLKFAANPETYTQEDLNKDITSLPEYKTMSENFEKAISKKPLIALDIAMAYSHFLGDKSQDLDDEFGRFGIWTSLDFAFNTKDIKDSSYLHLYGVFRYLRDGLNINEDSLNLFSENSIDYGFKIEFEFDVLSFAYERISRDNENNNASRSIGTIQYKINDSLILNGGFGENFNSEGTLTSILGIQWGLDFSPSTNLGID